MGKGRELFRNPWSYFGGLLMAGSVGVIAFLLLLEFSLHRPSPYLGIFTYMIAPMFFLAGGVLFLWGMRRESLRRRKAGSDEARPYPHLDLNDAHQRRRFVWVLFGGSFLALVLAFTAYNAFLFTESVTFCGELCHTVMEPEHTAYQGSPHSRVPCVDCHVGHGASWYVKSKLSGARQVVKTILDSYERPIPTPIENLRPARETCEECHWPEKFFGARMMQNPHFRYDEGNTAEQVSLLVKTGGGAKGQGGSSGIHWHMILDNEVRYKATDRKRQDIVWMASRDRDGNEVVYTDLDRPMSAEELAALDEFVVDCTDCHNRPTHIYEPPDTALDKAMARGAIRADLPWIKKVAADALVKPYDSREAADAGIAAEVRAFYEANHPEVARGRAADLDAAVAAVLEIHRRAVFPKMKVDWQTYASNIGHRNWPGCFRCHDGRHATAEGSVLTRDCAVCHTMPQRGVLAPLGDAAPISDLDWHRWQLKGKHATMNCDTCHAAGYRPPLDCAECHKLDRKAPMMGADFACADCHVNEQEVKPIADCKDCHDDIGGLHKEESHVEDGCGTCHKPHGWKTPEREACLACHDDMKDHEVGKGACASCHKFEKDAEAPEGEAPAAAAEAI
jgi:nitrate/TMAO reductase-like tetraheme cytochrome c subunit